MDDVMDNEFASLRGGPPTPRHAAAKERAVALAMRAFDEERKNSAGAQGSEYGRRLTDALKQMWSLPMKRKTFYRSAAAALVLFPSAGYIAYNVNERMDRERMSAQLQVQFDSPQSSVGLSEQSVHGGVRPLDQAYVDALSTADRQRSDVARSRGSSSIPTIVGNSSDTAAPLAIDLGSSAMTAPSAIQRAIVEANGLPPGQIASMMQPSIPSGMIPNHGDRFVPGEVSSVRSASQEPVSTFSVDVDTASYSYARRSIMDGMLPAPDSVRVEEMVNYFPYDWQGPSSSDEPFRANVTVMPTPWNSATKLMHIGIKGYDIPASERRGSNVVFLIDVSGSMNQQDKLPLLKNAFRMFVNTLRADDTVSIVTYAGASGIALRPTSASDKAAIFAALDSLQAGGGTNGASGIATAYALAEQGFVEGGVNRIFLATDGDFNVGASGDGDLKTMVEAKRKSGVFLSVLGFGGGNYNDGLMQTLAQNGNGVAAYIDTLAEAQKTLVQESTSSMFTIAKDVKIQVEFNPAEVDSYRLIGYETRALNREDFNNDRVDAGEIGSGHTVTAIYEVTPAGSGYKAVDPLRYSKPQGKASDAHSGELAYVKIRYKKPDGDTSMAIGQPVSADSSAASVEATSEDVMFSVAVSAFGQKLRGETALSDYGWDGIASLAAAGRGDDANGYRSEFLRLVQIAGGLRADPSVPAVEAPLTEQVPANRY